MWLRIFPQTSWISVISKDVDEFLKDVTNNCSKGTVSPKSLVIFELKAIRNYIPWYYYSPWRLIENFYLSWYILAKKFGLCDNFYNAKSLKTIFK